MKLHTLLWTSALCFSATMASDSSIKQEGIAYIKMLGGALKTELKAHMQKDPSGLEALAFCTGSAERITKEINAKLPVYAKVRRTALKTRNESTNKPDATDIKVMQEYEASIANKTFDPKEIKIVKEAYVTRIYKPLLIKGVCLKCHGSDLNPQITNALKSAYPKDKAINFKEGELRGVIVSEIAKH